jgi:hypothetical protein
VIKEDEGIIWKDLYDRKKQISYSSWELEDKTLISEDSVKGLISHLSEYISRVNSAKNTLGRIDYPNKRKNIFGFDCYEVLYPSQNGGKTGDGKAYITENIIAPSILFKGPFSEKFLVMEYWEPAVDCILVFGATKLKPGKVNKKMFKWNLTGFKLI